MTRTDQPDHATDVEYGLYDADEHYYEAEDALTRHLAKEHRRLVKWVDIEGRRTLLIGSKLVTVVPNPTYDPVGVPGSLEMYFRSQNTDGIPIRDIIQMHPIQPEYRDRDARLKVMDAQRVDFTWLLPSLGLGLEEMLYDEPETLYAVFRAYNRWLDDDWGYDRDGRIQTGPMLTLVDPVEAEKDARDAIERGARFVTIRPAPIANEGKWRSPADPAHDRVWAMLSEAGVVVSMHAADSGYGRQLRDWGESDKFTGLKTSPLEEVLQIHIERPCADFVAAMICHGAFERHPQLKLATLELGTGWARDLLRRLRLAYGKTPQLFGRDPVEAFREHVWVTPFYEDSIEMAVQDVGIDHVLLGSDWPHPEGLSEPGAWRSDYDVLSAEDKRKALRENLKALVGH
jgi:predicted TIM-barrel fold metal-dependent hydrolase